MLKLKHYINNFKLSNIVYRIISSILILNIINLIKNNFKYDSVSFESNQKFIVTILILAIIFILLSVIKKIIKKEYLDYIITFITLTICSILWINSVDIFFIITLFLVFLILYKFKPDNLPIIKNKKYEKILWITLFISILTMLICNIVITVVAYLSYHSPNFDLGIPAQNFYYLKKVGLPLSTCERNKLISHFAIHFSPIYYLILPIYLLFPNTITIQLIGSILIVSTVIPIYLLCKEYKLSNLITSIICIIFCMYTPAICSLSFDFHENAFLLPLLMWLFYFYKKEKSIAFFITSVLILFIKEDTFIYLIIFGVYSIFDKKKQYGVPLIIISTIYFIIVKYSLETYGEGIMTDRYSNLIYNNSGLIGIINTVIKNPGYFLKQLLVTETNNLDKFIYVIELLLPLGFIPLISKEKKNYILLIPILLTLMTTYKYIYNIDFQYGNGIIAFLFYLFIMNIKDLNIKKYLIISLIGTLLIFKAATFEKVYKTTKNYFKNINTYKSMDETLKSIPQNASVNASTLLIPHIANRDIIYEIYFHEDLTDIDYVLIDARYFDYSDSKQNYLNNGYIIDSRSTDEIIILKRNE